MPWKDKERNKAFLREYGKKWRPAHPGFRNKYNWKIRGVDPREAESVYYSKDCCEACSRVLGGHIKHLDHDHSRKKVRGVLCKNCNQALGHFKDDPRIIDGAISYLTCDGASAATAASQNQNSGNSAEPVTDPRYSLAERRKRIHHRSEWRAAGLNPVECERVFESKSSCDICGVRFAESSQKCLDHNHQTKQVRGVLCASCNFGIGLMNDDFNLILRLKAYLNRF